MAKPIPPNIDTQVTVMRRLAPGRFEVVTGTVRGPLLNPKVLEVDVSLVVGRGTARKAIEKQKAAALAALGLSSDS